MSNFTTWRSLVDGSQIGSIPDSVTDHWPFGEGSGTTAGNEVSDRDLDIVGASWESDADSRGGQHLECDGTEDVIQNDDSNVWSGFDTVSQAIWIRPDDLSSRQFVAGGTDSGGGFGSGNHWSIAIEDNGELAVQYDNFTTFDVLTQGDWIHIAVRYSDAEGGSELFINGEFEGSISESGDVPSVDGYSVGGPVNGDRRFFDGGTDDPHVGLEEYWSNSDIQEIYEEHPRSD